MPQGHKSALSGVDEHVLGVLPIWWDIVLLLLHSGRCIRVKGGRGWRMGDTNIVHEIHVWSLWCNSDGWETELRRAAGRPSTPHDTFIGYLDGDLLQ